MPDRPPPPRTVRRVLDGLLTARQAADRLGLALRTVQMRVRRSHEAGKPIGVLLGDTTRPTVAVHESELPAITARPRPRR